MIALATGVRVLLDDDTGGEAKKAGPLWAAVVIALCVAAYFLFTSMSRHLRKVREHPFDAIPPDGSAAPAAPVAQSDESDESDETAPEPVAESPPAPPPKSP